MTPSYSSGPAGPAVGRRAATFAGASVFLSRNLVAPEVFDAVHDALRLNGAEVLLCADPSRTGPLDFHVISSSSHERFADLRAKGCNLLGPQCILSCAKERRSLPKQSYTCCLAMDGVKTLCSGFEKSEKVRIEELVTAMGGHLLPKQSLDVNFVIVKDVTAAKYKWALDTLKKPIVTMKWLEQCWIEHRVVPHEPYRILPFTGLNICVTKLDSDERKELEKMVVQNGGQFSPCLTRKCTHLVANKPGGDKYIVAQKWGNIHIVNPRWVEQSVARRACQDENSYLVCQSSYAFSGSKSSLKEQQNPEISSTSASFQSVPATSVDDSVSMSQYLCASFGDAARISNADIVAAPTVQETNEMQVDTHVAEDSELENDDLYLSNCRISLVGFEEKESLRLVMMIRNGGGSRHILLSEKLTHIVIGTPSDDEKKEVRRLAAWGVINIVKVTWLEDCNRAKKEVKVSPMHTATDLLLKGFSQVSMENSADTRETKVGKSSGGIFHVPIVSDSNDKYHEKDVSSERKPKRGKHEKSISKTQSAARTAKLSQQNGMVNVSEYQPQYQVTSAMNSGSSRSNIFKGRTFSFSNSFSHDKVLRRRAAQANGRKSRKSSSTARPQVHLPLWLLLVRLPHLPAADLVFFFAKAADAGRRLSYFPWRMDPVRGEGEGPQQVEEEERRILPERRLPELMKLCARQRHGFFPILCRCWAGPNTGRRFRTRQESPKLKQTIQQQRDCIVILVLFSIVISCGLWLIV